MIDNNPASIWYGCASLHHPKVHCKENGQHWHYLLVVLLAPFWLAYQGYEK